MTHWYRPPTDIFVGAPEDTVSYDDKNVFKCIITYKYYRNK